MLIHPIRTKQVTCCEVLVMRNCLHTSPFEVQIFSLTIHACNLDHISESHGGEYEYECFACNLCAFHQGKNQGSLPHRTNDKFVYVVNVAAMHQTHLRVLFSPTNHRVSTDTYSSITPPPRGV